MRRTPKRIVIVITTTSYTIGWEQGPAQPALAPPLEAVDGGVSQDQEGSAVITDHPERPPPANPNPDPSEPPSPTREPGDLT
jgi:hypothetical protein